MSRVPWRGRGQESAVRGKAEVQTFGEKRPQGAVAEGGGVQTHCDRPGERGKKQKNPHQAQKASGWVILQFLNCNLGACFLES